MKFRKCSIRLTCKGNRAPRKTQLDIITTNTGTEQSSGVIIISYLYSKHEYSSVYLNVPMCIRFLFRARFNPKVIRISVAATVVCINLDLFRFHSNKNEIPLAATRRGRRATKSAKSARLYLMKFPRGRTEVLRKTKTTTTTTGVSFIYSCVSPCAFYALAVHPVYIYILYWISTPDRIFIAAQ